MHDATRIAQQIANRGLGRGLAPFGVNSPVPFHENSPAEFELDETTSQFGPTAADLTEQFIPSNRTVLEGEQNS